MSIKSNLRKSCILVLGNFWTKFDVKILNFRAKNRCFLKVLQVQFWVKFNTFSKDEILKNVFQFWRKIFLKVTLCQNWFFGQKSDFWNNVQQNNDYRSWIKAAFHKLGFRCPQRIGLIYCKDANPPLWLSTFPRFFYNWEKLNLCPEHGENLDFERRRLILRAIAFFLSRSNLKV